MKKIYGPTLLLLALTSCADIRATKIGSDTYQISTHTDFGGAAAAKADALSEANEFCENLNREMQPADEKSTICSPQGSCGDATIDFYCLVAGDPKLRGPRFQTDP